MDAAGWAGVDIEKFPNLKAWDERMEARPGVDKGKNVPDRYKMKEMLKNPEEQKRLAEAARKWIVPDKK